MKRSSYEQFAIVASDSASLFTEQLNEEICRPKDMNPSVHFSESTSPFYARIKYTEDFTKPETLSDEYELQGVSFVCLQCPYFKPGDFEHAEFGRTYKTTPACDKLYELIKEGDVKLCFM